MREDYDFLSDATKETLAGNVKAISRGWEKSDKYLYQILSGEKADFFPAFLSMYTGALKSGVSTCHWDNELEFARYRYGKPKQSADATDCFKEKLRVQNMTMTKFIESFADGEFDEQEIKDLEACLTREKQNIEMIETMLNFRKDILQSDKSRQR